MTQHPFTGAVLFRDRATTDGRRFTADAQLTWRKLPMRVIAKDLATGVVIGEITSVEDLGTHLAVSGAIDLEPGDYPCGVDMDQTDVVPATVENIQALLDTNEMVFTAGRLAALTVYTDGAEPAWPGCHITVSAAP